MIRGEACQVGKECKEAQVSKYVVMVERADSKIADAVSRLHDRLEPVLRPEPPSTGGNGRPGELLVPLAGRLESIFNRLSQIAERLESINERLEV